MLSKQEYDKTVWQLKHMSREITGKYRKNLRSTLNRKIHEHDLSSTYPPFEPLPYIPYFVNRTTPEQTLHQLIQVATTSTEFTLDTESVNIYRTTNKPVLIQLQILLPHNLSLVNVIEMCHLPPENHICFKLLKQLFQIIFSKEKQVYIWGSTGELFPFITFKLFSYEQIDGINLINLQDQFKTYWNQQHIHKSNEENDICICESCLGKQPSETWSLQDSVALELHEYLSKVLTNQSFDIGLDPNLQHMNSSEKNHRQQLTTYALYDCLSMQRIIISMKNNKFKFISSNENTRSVYFEFLPIISIDDDDDDDIFSIEQPTVHQSNKRKFYFTNHDNSTNKNSSEIETNAPSTEIPINNSQFSLTKIDSIPSSTYARTNSPDWNFTSSNNNNPITFDPSSEQSISTHPPQVHTELTSEQKKKIHNKTCTLRQRQRCYKHELIFKNIDRRFTIRKIKNILRQHNISFYANAVNTSISRKTNKKQLYVGIREPSLLEDYKAQTKHFFTAKHYHRLQQHRHNSYRNRH
ncbi:unnamed protein product [Rotaria sordida]|uniref:Uncharacterized protein n=1 Tax=Rotaria sordida TaxID=392033 RepID=A0A819GYF5_9BILA|nr:unnamed protein product [Rotaria sordida]CAF4093407.1 unnamed protein product [Rotaria sordida]